jgi:hypothetical protein
MTDEKILTLLAEWGLSDYSIAEEDMINFVRSIHREALEEAAKLCERWIGQDFSATEYADAIRSVHREWGE